MLNKRITVLAGLTACFGLATATASAQSVDRGVDAQLGYGITYQGQLDDAGGPANGTYDMRFSLFSSSGVQINSPVTYIGISVVDGVFTVNLDFDPAIWEEFASIEKYLQIEVRSNGGGAYTALTPRTLLSSAPHANVAQVAHGLTFPYTETITGFLPTDTAIDLSVNAGTALRLHSPVTNSPKLVVQGDNLAGVSFSPHIIRAEDTESSLGLVSVAKNFSLVGYNRSPSGTAAILAEVSTGGSESASALYARNGAAGTTVYLARSNYAGLFSGDLHVEDGEATTNYNFSPSPMAPAAYGFVNSDGTVASGTANMIVAWNAASSQYEISLSDQTLGFNTHTSVVTVVDTFEPRVATTNVVGGDLLVKIWDINSGNVAAADNFQIVIFNANPAAPIARSPVPAGMDPEYYYQQTGTTPAPVPYADPVEMPEPASAIED